MDYWTHYSVWRERRKDLLREAQQRQLERGVRKAREAFARSKKRPEVVEVRWGLPEDEAKVAELLELNGMPRWVAFEERFVVAEIDTAVLAAVRYKTEPKRLRLGLLVADPWAEERRLAVDLYTGARKLGLELGTNDIVARIDRHRETYPYEAGYHRWAGDWRMDLSRPVERREGLPSGGWRRRIALLRAFVAALQLPKEWSRNSMT
jgi:hypothetical protein